MGRRVVGLAVGGHGDLLVGRAVGGGDGERAVHVGHLVVALQGLAGGGHLVAAGVLALGAGHGVGDGVVAQGAGDHGLELRVGRAVHLAGGLGGHGDLGRVDLDLAVLHSRVLQIIHISNVAAILIDNLN